MDVNELLAMAWAAVEKSRMPEHLHEAAFKEAVAFLRSDAGGAEADSKGRTTESPSRGKKRAAKAATGPSKDKVGDDTEVPHEDEFFERLASESGVDEQDLRDILQLASNGAVHISPPTKNLGDTVAEQARNVIALVAGARSVGLMEKPVNAKAVRDEADRKRCYQQNNYSANHLRPMKGFNAGASAAEIVLTSKWVSEFVAAVDRAHGRVKAEK